MVGGVKEKLISLFKTTTTKDYNKSTNINNSYGGQINPRKQKIKKHSNDRIIKNLSELEEYYSKPVNADKCYSINFMNTKVMVIEIKSD